MRTIPSCLCAAFVLGLPAVVLASPQGAEELLGTWRGTSTCTDRVAAPACQDEAVVYEFRKGEKAGTVILAADKVVSGRRVPMGEMTFAFDAALGCWRSDFESPRLTSRWCFTIEGDTLKGTATLLPGKEVVRRVAAKRETQGGSRESGPQSEARDEIIA